MRAKKQKIMVDIKDKTLYWLLFLVVELPTSPFGYSLRMGDFFTRTDFEVLLIWR
jgi:hypothetical protein